MKTGIQNIGRPRDFPQSGFTERTNGQDQTYGTRPPSSQRRNLLMHGNRNRSSRSMPVRGAVDGFAAAILLILFIMPAHAQSGSLPVSVGADASTLGLGLQASVLLSPNAALRLGGNSYDYNKSGTSGSLNYNGKIKLQNYTV